MDCFLCGYILICTKFIREGQKASNNQNIIECIIRKKSEKLENN